MKSALSIPLFGYSAYQYYYWYNNPDFVADNNFWIKIGVCVACGIYYLASGFDLSTIIKLVNNNSTKEKEFDYFFVDQEKTDKEDNSPDGGILINKYNVIEFLRDKNKELNSEELTEIIRKLVDILIVKR
jgi:hypothetical protein